MDSINNKEKIELIIKNDEDQQISTISIRKIIEVIFQGKWLILGSILIFFIICLSYIFIMDTKGGSAQTIIELNFPGIESGLNPDKTKFELQSITAPAVIQGAIDELGLNNINTDMIRKDISIEPIVPKDISDKALAAIKSGTDFVYYPNKFIIEFSNLNFDKATRIRLLNSIISQFATTFKNKYSGIDVLGNALGDIDLNKYDYPDISIVLQTQINSITDYIQSMIDKDPNFRSAKTGLSFSDITSSLNILGDIDVGHLQSIIRSNNLTKDKDKLIKVYQDKILMNELNMAKKSDESATAISMMGSYNLQQNAVIIPGLTGTDAQNPYTLEGNSYYDELAKRAADAGVQAKNYQHENDFLKTEIDRLQNDTVPYSTKKSAMDDVNSTLDSIKSNISDIIQKANATALDYFDVKFNKAVATISPAEIKLLNKTLYFGVAIIFGIFVGLMIVFFRAYWRNSKQIDVTNAI